MEHVLKSELAQIWKAMRPDDVLVFYQHKTDRKKGTSWIKPKQEQFKSALDLSNNAVKIARGETATDVAFFFAQKPDAHRAKHVAPAKDQTETVSKKCPECDRLFGKGFGGIDAHWKANHEKIMPYNKAWPLIQAGNYHREELRPGAGCPISRF